MGDGGIKHFGKINTDCSRKHGDLQPTDSIGQLRAQNRFGYDHWMIVGVAEDIKVNRLTERPMPYFYVPIRQIYRPEMGLAFYARTPGSTQQAIVTLRREAQAVDATIPVFDTMPLSDYIAGSLFSQKITASLLTVLAVISFLLAALGLYGVTSYSVAQRTGEIGIRVALGAQPRDIFATVVVQASQFVLGGLGAGSLIGALSARAVSAMLPSISPMDPGIYVAAGAFIVVIAAMAAVIPAHRAMRVDPMVALRYE
jgi:FtsX-like permease family